MLLFMFTCALARAVPVERLDPRLDQITKGEVAVDVVAEGFGWVEGPLWLADGRLLFADIKANQVRELRPDGRVGVVLTPSGYRGAAPYPGPEPGSSAMALDQTGRVVVAGHAGRSVWRFDRVGGPKPGAVAQTTLLATNRGRALNSPNDLVVARDKSIYFTDPPFGLPTQKPGDPWQQQKIAGVYQIVNPGARTQRTVLVTGDIPGPNGLALSPDERTLYVADTPGKRWVKLTRGADQSFGPPETFAVVGKDDRPGEPDGLKVDARGNVFAVGPGGVWILDPAGRHLGTIPLATKASNLAWGADQRTLFVTATDRIYRLRLSAGDTAGSAAKGF